MTGKIAMFRCCLEETAKFADILLLARRPKDAIPDAKHPGKAKKFPGGKLAFPPGIFFGFLGQKLSIFRISQQQAAVVPSSRPSYFA